MTTSYAHGVAHVTGSPVTEAEAEAYNSILLLSIADQSASLVPSFNLLPLFTALLPTL
jgi:hypothetical protein